MALLKRKPKKEPSASPKPRANVQTRSASRHPFSPIDQYVPLTTPETRLYEAMREAIPLIDSALYKIQRLIGGFYITCPNKEAEEILREFIVNIPVGASSRGLEYFICSFLDSLLLYGNAVGEIVLDSEGKSIVGLYNASPDDVVIKKGKSPFDSCICRKSEVGEPTPVPYPQLICFNALNPKPGKICGDSILKSLPFVSKILLQIYHALGENFDRIGNVRFAVTYKPSADSVDRAYAKERAEQIAKEWSEGMAASKRGDVRDFVTVGDVDIKVIGADNQMIDCEVPARQMMEQIISKLSLPPFLFGISWSTTERMSSQQAEMLSKELNFYRRQLDPIIQQICSVYLRLQGYCEEISIEWDELDFDEQINAAKARLYNAQAEKLEIENGKQPHPLMVEVSAQNMEKPHPADERPLSEDAKMDQTIKPEDALHQKKQPSASPKKAEGNEPKKTEEKKPNKKRKNKKPGKERQRRDEDGTNR